MSDAARTDTATVLFTDLAGSTELRSRVGEEAADDIRHEHDRLVANAIEANRGNVVKHLGDGMMATFTGAADGLAGAVAIQRSIDTHNRQASNERLEVRIGLSVGDVSFEGDDCFGLPVVEAQRLEAAAKPGQILCSDLVQLMSRGRGGHVFVPVGDLDLKGIEQPVAALEVEWAPAEPVAVTTQMIPRLLSTTGAFDFAGREPEFATLVEAWKHAAAGVPSVVLVSGEPGIGKTRLVAELARRALEDDAIILAGRCDEHVSLAYRPFVEALRTYVEHRDVTSAVEEFGSRAGELQRLVPELADRVGDVPAMSNGDPEFERFQLLDAIAGWIRVAAEDAPVLLVLDDLHWAEGPTLAALRHVVGSIDEARLLVVGTYRDTDLDRSHPLAAMLADFRRLDTVSRLDLDGLSAQGVEEFLSVAAGHELDEAGLSLAAAVFRETAGNPFFVGEVLRHLAESGAIEQRDGVWGTDLTLEDLGIPEGIREVVGRRLTRLSDTAEKALSAAAVVGHSFEVNIVAQVSGLDVDDLLDALDEGAAANLVLDDGVDRYRFAHALVRTTLEEELSTTRRSRLHRKTALALEELHADHLDDIAPELAHHWAETADPDPSTAITWAIRAGKQNLDRAAPDDALRWFESGLDLLDQDDPDLADRARLLVLAATARQHLGDPNYRELALKGARIALDLGDAATAAEALMINPRMAWTRGTPSDPERVEIITAARELVSPDDTLTQARLMVSHAEQLLFLGDRDTRTVVVDELVEIAQGGTLPDDALHEIVAWLAFLTPPTHPNIGSLQGLVEQSTNAIAETNNRLLQTQNAFQRVFRATLMGERPTYDEFRRVIDVNRHEVLSAQAEMTIAMTDILHGQMFGHLDLVDAAANRLVEVSTAQDDATSQTYQSLAGFLTARERGTMAQIRPILELLHSDDAAGPTAAIRAAGLSIAGAIDTPRGAGEELEAARPFDDVADDPGYPITVWGFAEATAIQGHEAAARELLPLLSVLDVDGRVFMVTGAFAPGAVTWWMARLQATIGDNDAADELFRRALAAHDDFEATAHQARSRVDYAEFCLDCGRGDDATQLAGEALDLVGDGELADSRNRAHALLNR